MGGGPPDLDYCEGGVDPDGQVCDADGEVEVKPSVSVKAAPDGGLTPSVRPNNDGPWYPGHHGSGNWRICVPPPRLEPPRLPAPR